MSVYTNVFSEDDILRLNALSEVMDAKARLQQTRVVYFTIPLTPSLRASLESKMGLNLRDVADIPMRWIQGDTPHHVDVGASGAFENTYLVYLNDSEGEFVLGTNEYPITSNTAYVFNEGVEHKTQNTGSLPRLLVGPMNELAHPVGNPFTPMSMNYFPTQYDAQNATNLIYQSSAFFIRNLSDANYMDPPLFPEYTYSAWCVDGTQSVGLNYHSNPYTLGEDTPVDAYTEGDGFGQYYLYPVFLIYYGSVHDVIYDNNQLSYSTTSYTLDTINGISNWLIHSSSTGTSAQSSVYASGSELNAGGTYYLYPAPYITYYANQADAIAQTNPIGTSSDYTVDTFSGVNVWNVETSNSTGSSSGSKATGDALNSGGLYYLYAVGLPSSNICFPGETPVLTDAHGHIHIDKLNPEIHTIRSHPIVAVTATLHKSDQLVSFAKNALGKNMPSETTVISPNHKIMWNGHMIKAKDFVNSHWEGVSFIPYRRGEVLYNVLLEKHGKMMVNNLVCETLDPENGVARLYRLLKTLSPEQQNEVLKHVSSQIDEKRKTR